MGGQDKDVRGASHKHEVTYSTVFVALDRFLLPPTEATLIDKLRQLLLDEILDLCDGHVKALLRRARHV
jgi:hypothetical protein